MFERYTEKARRVIFCARYEASQLFSPYIETEHLLLGVLREEAVAVGRLLPGVDHESIRKEIQAHTSVPDPEKTPNVDLPLSNESKRALALAAEEADRLSHRHIGTEHLLLALLLEKTPAAELLKKRGARLSEVRQKIVDQGWPSSAAADRPHYVSRVRAQDYHRPATLDTIEIHGQTRNAEYIRRAVKAFLEIPWHWEKRKWKPRDVAIHRTTGAISFDVSVTETSQDFDLLKGGWKKDVCTLCRWELFTSKDSPEHATGYTNGRDWLCTECYDKFIARSDFFSSNYPDIT